LKQYDEALESIKEAIKLNPSDKNFRDEFEKIKALRNKAKDAEKLAI
jgi:tetratricopeptide (TPR) repeat protein